MFTYENQGTNTYLVYELAPSEELDTLSLGMVSNNNIPGIAQELFTQMNVKKYVKYNISSKIPLEELFDGVVTKRRLLDVFTNICATLMEAEEYMLDTSVFMWDAQRIYVDISTNETSMLCKPVLSESEAPPDLRTFFKELIFGITLDSKEDNSYFTSILNFLNGKGVFVLTDFKRLLDNLQKETVVVQRMTQKADTMTPPSVAVTASPVEVQAEPRMANYSDETSAASDRQEQPQPARERVSLARVVALKESQKEQQATGTQEIYVSAPVQGKSRRLFGRKNSDKTNDKEKAKAKSEGGLFSSKKKSKDLTENNTFAFDIPGQPAAQPVDAIPSQPAVDIVPIHTENSREGENVTAAPQYSQKQDAYYGSKTAPAVDAVSRPANFGSTTVLNAPQQRQSHPTVVLSELNPASPKQRGPYLLRVKNNEKIEINSEKIKIGKEAGFVDYVISDNSTVSRFHAAVTKKNSDVYIVDMNSSNHTYVNGQMITSNQEILLHDQDHIRFSNEEFIFTM